MRQILHFEIHLVSVERIIALDEFQIHHIGAVLGEDAGHFGQRAGAVIQHRADPPDRTMRAFAPGQIDPVGIDAIRQFQAVNGMHFHAHALAPQPDNPVSRHRVAAFGQGKADARRQPLDRDRAFLRGLFGEIGRAAGHKRFHQRAIGYLRRAHGIHQIFLILHFQPLHRLADRFLADAGGQAVGDFLEQLAADFGDFLALFHAHGAADAGARLAGDDKAQPAQLRFGIGAFDDFHHIAIVQPGAQRHVAAIDLGPHRLRAEIGVHGESEINRRRALGQLEQRAFGRESENPVLIDCQLGVFEQLFGIMAGIDDLDQIAQPAHRAIGPVALLVGPVRGKAEFVRLIHFARADLHFDAHRAVVEQRRVQRFVAIVLGRRDVILEPPRHELKGLVENAERAVAILRTAGEHAEGHDVGHLLERQMPLGHFAPDRIGMLFAPPDFDFHPRFAQSLLDVERDPVNLPGVRCAQLFQPFGDGVIGFGFELFESEQLHFPHIFIHAHTLCQRGVDIHRLACDAVALFRLLDVMQRAHIVQPVRQLDEQHAQIFGHGEQEFAQIFRRPLILRHLLDLAELGDAIDQPGNILAEILLHILDRGEGILHRIVEQRGDDGFLIELQIGHQSRDFDRMAEIGIAAGAHLAAMLLHRIDIGTVEHRLIGVRVIFLDPFD